MITVRVHENTLQLQGDGSVPASAALRGPRVRVPGIVTADANGTTWTISFALEVSRWRGPLLPLPAGEYIIELSEQHVDLAGAHLPLTLLPTLRVGVDGNRARIGPPIDPSYDSGEGQAALERRYASAGNELENAVFFESFYGRNVSCNPLAIDREIARVAPHIVRYWSVTDLSIAVPDGATAVVEGSPEWWRARGTSRLLIVNDWLRRRFTRRKGQRVLQTWHGTPLKRLALHRPGFDPRRVLAVIRESRRWDALLAQNPYAAKVMRSAYRLRRPLWVDGYPRNDVLQHSDRVSAEVREQLGIVADDTVLLWAPTWRDDREEMVEFLDPNALAERTGAVVLVRGHSRTLLPGKDKQGARVIDVTGYGDMARLLATADALITDYSSVMFDFSVTGRPMYFFVPDIEHYRGELRGFYFDLEAEAPGPLVRTPEDLYTALSADEQNAFESKYLRWQQRFNARDDGRAAERVVARLLDQNWLVR